MKTILPGTLLIIILSLFLVRGGVSAYTAWWQGVTIDEPDFLMGGLLSWKEGDYWIEIDNPPLLKMLYTLPAMISGAQLPDHTQYRRDYAVADHYSLGKAYLFESNPSKLAQFIIYSARAVTAVVYLTLVAIFLAVMRGRYKGRKRLWLLVPLAAFFLFDPAFLSLSTLAVLGPVAAMVGALALIATMQWAVDGDTYRGIGVALLWAIAVTIKFTSLVMLFIAAALVIIRLICVLSSGGISMSDFPRRRRLIFRQILLMGAIFFLVVWVIYGFEWGPMAGPLEPRYLRKGESLEKKIDALPSHVQTLMKPLYVPVPMPSFFAGVVRILRAGGIDKRSWFMGKIHPEGSRLYYSGVFLLKTPLSVLLLATIGAWGCMISLRRGCGRGSAGHEWGWRRCIPLAVSVIYVLIVFSRKNNMGYRYLLPVMPFVFILAADGVGMIMRMKKLGFWWTISVIVGILAISDVSIMLSAGPNQLAFSNALAGGPKNTWRVATDSNVDWGQEIRRLKPLVELIRERGMEPRGIIYTPDSLPFYDIDLPQVDEEMWKQISSDAATSKPIVLIWSATKAAGFSPAPADAQEFMVGKMKQSHIQSYKISPGKTDPFPPTGTIAQFGQAFFFTVLGHD